MVKPDCWRNDWAVFGSLWGLLTNEVQVQRGSRRSQKLHSCIQVSFQPTHDTFLNQCYQTGTLVQQVTWFDATHTHPFCFWRKDQIVEVGKELCSCKLTSCCRFLRFNWMGRASAQHLGGCQTKGRRRRWRAAGRKGDPAAKMYSSGGRGALRGAEAGPRAARSSATSPPRRSQLEMVKETLLPSVLPATEIPERVRTAASIPQAKMAWDKMAWANVLHHWWSSNIYNPSGGSSPFRR